MMTTMAAAATEVAAPPKAASRRSNSEDFQVNLGPQQRLDVGYEFQRASSSEALLPSPGKGAGSPPGEERDDDSTASGSHGSHPSIPRHNSGFGRRHTLEPTNIEKPQKYSRSKSDSPNLLQKKLQTIESGISLADSAAGGSPKPPLHPTNGRTHSQGSLPPLPLPEDDVSDSIRPDIVRKRLQSDQTAQSLYSYYSVDAGKHGFLAHRSGSSDEVDSIAANSANDSLVFKYHPGEETPPAEYMLPASIMQVYGDNLTPEEQMQNGHGMEWHRVAGSGGTDLSRSSIFYSPSDEESGPAENGRDNKAAMNGMAKSKARGPPMGIPHLMASPHDDNSEDLSRQRVLPYHERKRLLELEEEERRRKKELKLQKQQARVDRANRKNSERTPLNSKRNGYGSATNNTDNSEEKESEGGWFGKLVSIVTGDEKKECRDSIADETKDYRNKGEEFLRKTEKERTKLLEERRMDELNNVTVPVTKQSFGGHNRAKMSSLSNALDSIASVSFDEEEEESSDEESGYYWTEQEEEPQTARVWKYGEPPTNPTKAANGRNGNPKKPGKMASGGSQRDRAMRRERLMQEEYEYRLRNLRRENEKLSKKFRVFVLVAVALIFAGALAFAFVVCVRMLMSI